MGKRKVIVRRKPKRHNHYVKTTPASPWHRPYLDENAGWVRAYAVTTHLLKVRELGLGAELGVMHGWHSDQILLRCPTTSIIGIDSYSPDTTCNAREGYNAEWCENAMQDMVKLLAPHGDRFRFIHAATEEASKEVADGALDWVYIDATHDEESVYEDMGTWFGKLKGTGSLFMGHDYDVPGFDGVKIAVDRFLQENRLKLSGVDRSVWWVDL